MLGKHSTGWVTSLVPKIILCYYPLGQLVCIQCSSSSLFDPYEKLKSTESTILNKEYGPPKLISKFVYKVYHTFLVKDW